MILDEIVEKTKLRIAKRKEELPKEKLMELAALCKVNKDFPFEAALRKKDISFICEVKKASPSKSIIAEEFDYLKIAKDYEEAGADMISVLTEPYFFLGADAYLKEIKAAVTVPVLRKDFVVDSYMLYEAKLLGADAVLLICACLTNEKLEKYLSICEQLGLTALVEAHEKQEVSNAIAAGARVIGVNNRNLKTFEVDATNCLRLREYVGDQALFVAESGIRTAEDIRRLRASKVDAVLIGETLMRAKNKSEMLHRLKNK